MLKKIAKNIGLICAIPFIIAFCFLVVGYLILTSPIELIRYRLSPYFRDIRKKYHLTITYNNTYRTYNEIKCREIPEITFYPKDSKDPDGWFVLRDILIFPNTEILYDAENDSYYVTDEDSAMAFL